MQIFMNASKHNNFSSVPTFNKSDIVPTIKKAFADNNIPYPETLQYEFSNRFTARLGDASIANGFRIRFSVPLWQRATTQERKQVCIHEACHIIAFIKYGVIDGWKKAHGPCWKSCMRQAGVQPDRCHSVDRTGLSRQMKRYLVKCDCGHPHALTARKVRHIDNYHCSYCKGRLTVVENSY